MTSTNFLRVLALLVLLLLLPACGGLFEGTGIPRLGVPYIQQEQHNYCVPASIAMWRGYDGLTPVSQTEIWNAIGGAPCDGLDAAYGVRRFTSSGYDAYLDLVGPIDRDDFLARQLTSIDRRVPVMVIVGPSRSHVGIINGGSYQYTASTDRYTWNTVLLHDPDYLNGDEDQEWDAGDWARYTCGDNFSHCGQVVSRGASYNWSSHLQAYGYSVDFYDGTCCNEENQN